MKLDIRRPLRQGFTTLALGLAASFGHAAAPALPSASLPATYIGTLPCADCAGIDWQLDLAADRSFELRQTYQGKGPAAAIRRTGQWRLDEAAGKLSLESPGQPAIRLATPAPDRLRLLDGQGQAIDSRFNHELKRLPQALPARASGTLTGLYRLQAGNATLRLCAPGQPEFPVAGEGAHRVLATAYGKQGHAPGEALLVRLAGHLAARPAGNKTATADGQERTMVVAERFYGIWPQAACSEAATVAARATGAASTTSGVAASSKTSGQAMATAGADSDPSVPAPFTGTTWRLVALDGQPVALERGPNTPHLIFQDNGRLAGADGCNRLMGSYDRQGDKLALGQLAGTLMACLRHGERAQSFVDGLGWVRSWQISGRNLVLRDADGKAVATFRAGPLQR
jgi:heat shock protein HslJ/uncharacterized lipoprotein NlpE involved in copper resistance